jgi:hypothetical protein
VVTLVEKGRLFQGRMLETRPSEFEGGWMIAKGSGRSKTEKRKAKQEVISPTDGDIFLYSGTERHEEANGDGASEAEER